MTPAPWLRILLYQDLPGLWVARSLEHDIAVEGSTTDAVSEWLLRIIVAHTEFDRRHGRPPLSAFPEAPRRYWNAFVDATTFRTVHCGHDGNAIDPARVILIALTRERPAANSSGRKPGVYASSSDTWPATSSTSLRVN
jgi:hypothetical protein